MTNDIKKSFSDFPRSGRRGGIGVLPEGFKSKEEIAESQFRKDRCSQTKIKAKLAFKAFQISRIEKSNSPDNVKLRKIINLYPKDKCWRNFVISDSGFS